ncbi:hypothetical protein J0910_00330 [Nocardiopsis sp. CNT-189]|uniref:hypothetical protein n=1 Tax=Nocardiopsis oceanisediminis TaxID=2816862 RepID=UPI003B30DC93
MTIRRLHVLVSRLPHGSATYAVRAGGRALADWTEQVELLAEVVEELRALRLTYVRVNTDAKKRHQLPDGIEHVPRPAIPEHDEPENG